MMRRMKAKLLPITFLTSLSLTLGLAQGAGHGFGGPEAIAPVEEFLKRCLK